ncbi:MAG: hypothetical protein JRJ10_03765 [Deltaproteobacteria bacterium]|nr:hypothetical protein [Deltaproteobacteria bacterium]
MGAKSAKEIGIEQLQIEALEQAMKVGHPDALARHLHDGVPAEEGYGARGRPIS